MNSLNSQMFFKSTIQWESLVDAWKPQERREYWRECERNWKASERTKESLCGSPLWKIGIRISCSKEIRQCMWTTALSPAALVWKKHIACEMVFYAVFLLCVDLFLSRCYFPSFKHMTVWERASIYSVAVSLNVGKSFSSEIIDLASTYKCVPFFKYDSQSSVCHYSVRFMWNFFLCSFNQDIKQK